MNLFNLQIKSTGLFLKRILTIQFKNKHTDTLNTLIGWQFVVKVPLQFR